MDAMASSSGSSYPFDIDDDEDVECPLCLDTLDISDLNFKPCSCGYQICRFCWHHIKENLNGRCPACRKPYDDAAIEFKPMKPEELKRLQAAKKQRDRERKDADTLSRRHAANVRVKQRAQVHIQGMTTKIANEDTLPLMKSNEQFGRYGRISKLFFSRRARAPPIGSIVAVPTPSTSSPNHVPVNVYINYFHPSEAAACIAALDGSITSDGHKLKAIWGTTRYCPAYLRGTKCTNESCMQAHEPGEEVESYTHPGSSSGGSTLRGEQATQQAAQESGTDRGEMRDLKHAWKEQEKEAIPALPPTASWASKQSFNPPAASSTPMQPSLSTSSVNQVSNASSPAPVSAHSHSSSISSRLPKAQNHPLPPRPPSRIASVDTNKQTMHVQKPSINAEPLHGLSNAPSSQLQSFNTGAERGRQIERGSEDADFSNALTFNSVSTPYSAVPLSSVAPPTPPVSEHSDRIQANSSNFPTVPPILPPGLPVPMGGNVARPLTPVSEFDRTLDTFGDGLSFAFNLAAANGHDVGNAAKGHERIGQLVMDNGTPGSSRSASPDRALGIVSGAERPIQSEKGDRDVLHFNFDGPESSLDVARDREEQQLRYLGHFNPFSAQGGENVTEATGSSSITLSNNGLISASPGPTAPPGLSRAHSREGSIASIAGVVNPPGLAKPPGLPNSDEVASPANRHRSRFGFARQASIGSAALANGGPIGNPLWIGLPGPSPISGETSKTSGGDTSSAPSGSASASTIGVGTGINGRHSPTRPNSAASSASANPGFPLTSGVFSPAAGGGLNGSSAIFTSSIPIATTLPPSSSDLPLPPPDPSRQSGTSKTSLSELFPGINLAASFSSSSSLPPALVKSLGISLENLDVTASSAANGILSKFAPVTLGENGSIANQPLPPPSTTSSGSTSGIGSASNAPGNSHATNNVAVNGAHPPGIGSTRQAQQAHAQHAQQAHQAHLAAQRAQREQREREAQLQLLNQHSQHGRPPSAASGGSGKGPQQSDMYGFMGVQSPPLSGIPGSFSEASRFQDPAIVSYASLNGYGHHQHPYAHHGPYPHGMGPLPPIPGNHDQQGAHGAAEDFYSRYQPLPTPVQPQQTYNPYIPVAPVGVGLAGLGRLQAAQAMSQAGFGLFRR